MVVLAFDELGFMRPPTSDARDVTAYVQLVEPAPVAPPSPTTVCVTAPIHCIVSRLDFRTVLPVTAQEHMEDGLCYKGVFMVNARGKIQF